MKQQKHKSAMLLLGLFLLLMGINQGVSAQSYNTGQWVVGDATSLINGDFINASTGELYLGSHSPRGLQTNTLSITGSYAGEAGSQVFVSVIDNSNQPDTRGYIDIVGTATQSTGASLIVLDYFDASTGWNGACIDLVRANKTGSDAAAFRMDTMALNGHTAILRHRIYGNDMIWYLAEKLIVSQQTGAQATCLNETLNPLSVITAPGAYTYQWYRCDADGSNFVDLGSANGAQTANFTPPAAASGTAYYRCVVKSLACDYNTDTTAVSGAISIGAQVRIIDQPVSQIVPKDGSLDEVTLSVTAEGSNLTYQWYKNDVAISGETNADLTINLDGGTVDKYYVEVSGCGGSVTSETATVGYCLPIIAQKRNHTLVVNNVAKPLIDGGNGGYEFTYYTWYKNDELLKSEAGGAPGSFNTGGYYYTGGGNLNPDDEFYAVLRDINNRQYQTCVFHATIQVSGNISAYPIPVNAAGGYVVNVDAEVSDVAALAGATIDAYNVAGAWLGRTAVSGQITKVTLPSVPGVYVLVFKSSEISKEIKVIVE